MTLEYEANLDSRDDEERKESVMEEISREAAKNAKVRDVEEVSRDVQLRPS